MHLIKTNFLNAEEFGWQLFDAVKLCGGILHMRALREESNMRTVKPGQLTEWQKREKELEKQLKEIVLKLSDSDAGDLARKYEWVASL